MPGCDGSGTSTWQGMVGAGGVKLYAIAGGAITDGTAGGAGTDFGTDTTKATVATTAKM